MTPVKDITGIRTNHGLWLIRMAVGLVFLSEGIQKFLFPDTLGTGRFFDAGFSYPAFWAYFTAVFEIGCSIFILLNKKVKTASFPLLIIMIVAFFTTKLPILMNDGVWALLHHGRTDFAMTMLLIYLIFFSPGTLLEEYQKRVH
jgi:putative oxidoreductase